MRHRSHSHSHSHQVITRVRRAWNELDYAQRRLLEIRTGLPLSGPVSQRRDDHQSAMLEDLYRRGWRR
ncbi:MAG: hypothetical protein QOF83_327 [Solirubrobacteraceae bacterium]|jgi:hypothetical protein|nr:hypothetical protein [Solirubrobacteraceae bacterium]